MDSLNYLDEIPIELLNLIIQYIDYFELLNIYLFNSDRLSKIMTPKYFDKIYSQFNINMLSDCDSLSTLDLLLDIKRIEYIKRVKIADFMQFLNKKHRVGINKNYSRIVAPMVLDGDYDRILSFSLRYDKFKNILYPLFVDKIREDRRFIDGTNDDNLYGINFCIYSDSVSYGIVKSGCGFGLPPNISIEDITVVTYGC